MGDRIPGSPGAAMISHGHILKTRGGIAFNGDDAWLGGGDFAGGCISGKTRMDDSLKVRTHGATLRAILLAILLQRVSTHETDCSQLTSAR